MPKPDSSGLARRKGDVQEKGLKGSYRLERAPPLVRCILPLSKLFVRVLQHTASTLHPRRRHHRRNTRHRMSGLLTVTVIQEEDTRSMYSEP